MAIRRIINNNKFIIPILLLNFFISSCIHDTVYDEYRHVPDNGWTTKDTLTYCVALDSIPQNYILNIATRNRSDYPYNDIYLKVMNNATDSTKFSADTLKLVLGTKINGRSEWLGTGISGLFQLIHKYRSMTLPKRKGNITFKIVPLMRDRAITGISDIGLKLSTSSQRQYEGK